jgi:hypothetical protein
VRWEHGILHAELLVQDLLLDEASRVCDGVAHYNLVRRSNYFQSFEPKRLFENENTYQTACESLR